ncbi:MFS transporter [Ottowia sp.]|uniref:MFS transporter n=1 Tax=Ottowia sp. TaxID=1898956 RepID=UPI0025F3EDD9|nr:MFS transporter [Ottowia sp.]MBK6616676.1 MFS transporter [Ottowia sp.]
MKDTALVEASGGHASIKQVSRIAEPGEQGARSSLLAAIVAGNTFEFFDFVTYAFFAVYIGKAFFPASTPMASLLLSVGVFGVGFVSRPLGSILIGAYADSAGRRPAMLLTLSLITVGTLGLALTPSFESIGLWAPISIVVCRLVQGLALGGEVGPSSALLLELAPEGKAGLMGSWQIASQGLATLVAGLFGVSIVSMLSPAEVQAWGWRVPFLFGALVLPIALFLRRNVPETLGASTYTPKERFARLVVEKRTIVLATLVVMGGTIATYVGNYMTTFAITTLKLPALTAMTATVIVGLVTLVFGLLGGFLADRLGRKPVMIWGRLAGAVLTVPAFYALVANPSGPALFAVTGLLSALTAMSSAASLVLIMELLPRSSRSTGLSIAYALGVSVFGGSTQFIVVWLIGVTGHAEAPAWYVAATGLITVMAMLALPESLSTRRVDGEAPVGSNDRSLTA